MKLRVYLEDEAEFQSPTRPTLDATARFQDDGTGSFTGSPPKVRAPLPLLPDIYSE